MNTRFKKLIVTSMAIFCMTMLGVVAASAQRDNDHDGKHWRAKHGRYVVDDSGADVLRAAVRNGYQQGYQAGVADRPGRRNNWRRNQMYISGDMGYTSGVERTQYQYYFQQGFQKGYDDGFNSRNRYGRDNNILDNVLSSIVGLTRW
jgi:flagellar biosynthesis/type III secretory pathway protein FliH